MHRVSRKDTTLHFLLRFQLLATAAGTGTKGTGMPFKVPCPAECNAAAFANAQLLHAAGAGKV